VTTTANITRYHADSAPYPVFVGVVADFVVVLVVIDLSDAVAREFASVMISVGGVV